MNKGLAMGYIGAMEIKSKDIWLALAEEKPFALATILSHKGSAPRTSGARMLVHGDGRIQGTVGGGMVEGQVIEACHRLLDHPGSLPCRIQEFVLNQEAMAGLDMICGGSLMIWMERIDPKLRQDLLPLYSKLTHLEQAGGQGLLVSRLSAPPDSLFSVEKTLVLPDGRQQGEATLPKDLVASLKDPSGIRLVCRNLCQFILEPMEKRPCLYIFGAGHVGLKLARLCHVLDLAHVVVDDRPEFADRARFPEAAKVHQVSSFDRAFDQIKIPKESYIAILTRGHLHDQTVLEQALDAQAAYIGMIGSKKKRDTIYRNLMEKGISRSRLDQVHSPIGLSIHAETPAEIAVSILAQVILVKAERSKRVGLGKIAKSDTP